MTDFDEYRKEQSGYRLPEGYFEDKRRQLLEISQDEPINRRRVFRLTAGWIASGIAAAVLIAFFVFGPDKHYPPDQQVELDTGEISEYLLSSYNYELGEELLMMELHDEDLETFDQEPISQEELQLLIDENFDETLHYEYL